MKKYIILLILVSGVLHFARAQEWYDELSLQSVSSVGFLNGSRGSSFALQTIFGAAYHNTFAGLGIGIDYYRFRAIPLFADLRHTFGKGKRNMFFYGDIGYSLDWLTEKNRLESNYYSERDNYKGGLYYDAGMGYAISFKKADALLLSAGYSSKKIQNVIGKGICPLVGPCYDDQQTYRYYLSRLSLKAGWRF